MSCYTCDENGNCTQGSVWCGTCEIYLCMTCHSIHGSLPVSRDHTVTDVVEGTRINVRNAIPCEEHSNKAVEFYCKDCTKAVCPVCCILCHRKCEYVVTLQSLIPEMRSTLQENLQILSANMADIQSKLSANRDIYTQMQRGITGLQSEIASHCQLTRELITEKEDAMMKDLDRRTKEQRETLQGVIKIGESKEMMHKQQVEYIQITLESEGTMNLYELYQACLSGEILATSVDDYAITEIEPGLEVKVKAELETIRSVLNESLLLCTGPDNAGSPSSTITKDMEDKDGRDCIGAVEESDDRGIDRQLPTEQENQSDSQGPKLDIDEQIETNSNLDLRNGLHTNPRGGPRTNYDRGFTDMEKYMGCESELWSTATDELDSTHMVTMPTCTKSSKLQESRKLHSSAPQLNNGSHTTVEAGPGGKESLGVGSNPGGMFGKQESSATDVAMAEAEALPLKSKKMYQSAPNVTTIHNETENSLYPEFEQLTQLEVKRDLTPVTFPELSETCRLEAQEPHDDKAKQNIVTDDFENGLKAASMLMLKVDKEDNEESDGDLSGDTKTDTQETVRLDVKNASDSLKSKVLLPHDDEAKQDTVTDDFENGSKAGSVLKVDKEKEKEDHGESDGDLSKTDPQETVRLDVENASGPNSESETERAYNFDSDSLPVYHDTIQAVNSLDLVVLSLEHGFVYAVTNAMESIVKCLYRTSKKRCESTLRISNLPWAVTKMSNAMLAVTVPRTRQIVLANVDPTLQLHSIIRTHKSYYGLAVLEESMFVAGSTSDSCIDILALSGKVIRTISNSSVKCPNFICTTPKQGFIVSDRQTKTVMSFTATGEVDFTYSSKDQAFKENRGVVTTDSGHVLVADAEANKVVLLTEKGGYIRDVLTHKDDIRKPVGLYLHGEFLYVTQWQNRIKVFKFT